MSRSRLAPRDGLWLAVGLISMVFLVTTGCGRSDWGYVEGVVTLNGAPVGPGTLIFEPAGSGQTRSAVAHFGEDGRYELKSAGGEPGAPIGEYRVAVHGGGEESFGEEHVGPPPESKIPPRYLDPAGSGLTATVEPGDNTINFDLVP